MKREDGRAGHGGATIAGKPRQRFLKNRRWRIADSRFAVRSGGYDIEQVNQWLERIASLREKGFAPARYTPPDGFRRWYRGYDPELIDRYLTGVLGEAGGGPAAELLVWSLVGAYRSTAAVIPPLSDCPHPGSCGRPTPGRLVLSS